MTLRPRTARHDTSQIRPTTRIFDWLRDIVGLKEADDLMVLERVIIPRFQSLITTTADDIARLWRDLFFAAHVLQRRASFGDGERPKQRFDGIFDQFAKVAKVPVTGL